MSDEISPELEAAIVAFHAALDASRDTKSCHGYESSWVDGNSYAVVEALLAAGWKPPEATAMLPDDPTDGLSDAELHAELRHPGYEYETTTGQRKAFDEERPPYDDDGPDLTWERNIHVGRNGWERFDYHEEAYWMRRKRSADA